MSVAGADLDNFFSSASESSRILPPEGSYVIEFLHVIEVQEKQRTVYGTSQPMWDDKGDPLMEKTAYCQLRINDPSSDDDGYEFREYVKSYINIGKKGPTRSLSFVAAFLGMKPQDYMALPEKGRPGWRDLYNKKAEANMIHHTSATGGTYFKIDSIVPLRKRKPAPQVVADDDEPGF